MAWRDDTRGFTLVEALIAATLLAVAVIGFAQLMTRAMQQTLRARHHAVALTLAQSKLEQLRAAPWDFDASGGHVSAPDLAVSPADTLVNDTPPFVEALDRFGALLPVGGAPTYVRRWAIQPLAAGDPDTLMLSACVVVAAERRNGSADACVSTIRTRRP